MADIVKLSRELMYEQTQINKAPAWLLTELAIEKGEKLAKQYNVDEKLVLVSLYLAHTVFCPEQGGKIQMAHPRLSSEFAKKYLDSWGVPEDEQVVILNSIAAHHDHEPTKSLIAEIVKNAECAKFVTVKGALVWLHELGKRQIPFDQAVNTVIEKMEQKLKLLTLNDCISEANVESKKIYDLFNSISKPK